MKPVTLAHISDLHCGRDCDLEQLAALERYIPTLGADALVYSGDLTQRARHGELQEARRFLERLGEHLPWIAVAGNHDVQWWESPFHLFGTDRIYRKYRQWMGRELTLVLEIPGAIIATALTAHGVAFGSMTLNLNDMAVKGHLPASEVQRLERVFAAAPPDVARVVVMHHNLLRGRISHRMGLARWNTANRRLASLGADLVCCGHDHEEQAGQVEGRLAVSQSGTHTSRTRGGRPAAFNVVRIEEDRIRIRHHRWDAANRTFNPADDFAFARERRAVPAAAS